MTLSIGHVNAHNGKFPIRAARRWNCDSLGYNEVYRRIPMLERFRGSTVFYGTGARDQRRGPKDNPIVTKSKYPILLQTALQGSEAVNGPAEKFGPDRTITVQGFQHPIGRVAHINIHPNATVRNRHMQHPLVREYQEFMVTLQHIIAFVKFEKFIPVVTGDFQVTPKNEPFLTPYDVFESFNMRYRHVGIDGLGYDQSLDLRGFRIIDKKRLKTDHPGFVAEFVKS